MLRTSDTCQKSAAENKTHEVNSSTTNGWDANTNDLTEMAETHW